MVHGDRCLLRASVVCASLGLAPFFWSALARAQDRTAEQPDPAQTRLAEMAKALDPAHYDPAFYAGAQAEFATPTTGATSLSSLVLGYDARFLHVDLSVGLGLGGDALLDEASTEAVGVSLRMGIPIHRGIRADFSLMAGGGVLILDPPDAPTGTVGEVGGGGRFRVFMTPNVAVIASLGVVALIRGDHSSVIVGARPLGAAAVVYFFR